MKTIFAVIGGFILLLLIGFILTGTYNYENVKQEKKLVRVFYVRGDKELATYLYLPNTQEKQDLERSK